MIGKHNTIAQELHSWDGHEEDLIEPNQCCKLDLT